MIKPFDDSLRYACAEEIEDTQKAANKYLIKYLIAFRRIHKYSQ